MEQLEVVGLLSGTEGNSVNPEGEMGYRLPWWKVAREKR